MKQIFRFSKGTRGAARDVNDELKFHIDMRAREFIAAGMSPDDAQRAAEAAFGDVSGIAAEVRSVRIAHVAHEDRRDWWGGLMMDVMYAVRTLRKNSTFTTAAIATLTLGIGATVSVFAVVNGVLMRPLPYADPERLAMIWMTDTRHLGGGSLPLAAGFAYGLEANAPSFTDVAAFRAWGYTIATDGPAEPVAGVRASPALFSVLGARPCLGSVFTDSAVNGGDSRVAVLSYGYWQRRFGGARDAIGKRLILSGEPFTVIGVMPEHFSFPRGAELPTPLQFPARTDLWTPLVFTEADRANFGTQNLSVIGRLEPGVTHAQVQTAMTAALHRFMSDNNGSASVDYRVVTLKEQAGGQIRRSLLFLMGAVGFVLLIACANVANLLIGRTAARAREFSVRAALGAGRGRIARQLVTENVVLTLSGAALGLLFSMWSVRVLLSKMPAALPRADDVGVDWRVIVMTLAVALLAGGAFGMATAFHLRRINLGVALQAAGARLSGGVTRRLGRRLFVAGEIALSLMLVIGAAQLTTSFVKLQRIDPGFDTERALIAGVLMPLPDGFRPRRDGDAWRQFFTQLTERLAASPGIVAVGGSSNFPLTGGTESGRATIVGRPANDSSPLSAQFAMVSGEYFRAMGIRVIAGREFNGTDIAAGTPSAIINKSFARRYFGSENVVGEQITTSFEFFGTPQRTIVGVVDDVRQGSLEGETVPQVYLPQGQNPYPGLTMIVRTQSADPLSAVATVRAAVRALNPNAAITELRSLEDVVAVSVARQRFSMMIIVAFAAVSLLLAMVGLYGVISLSVRLRRREIGVRMALGARASSVVGLVLREGMWVTAIGLVIGAVGAAALSRALSSMLYDAHAADIPLFALSAIGVALVSVIATYVPARRAVDVHPTAALRAE